MSTVTQTARKTACAMMRHLQRQLRGASIDELIRLIGSEYFERVADRDIRAVAEYGFLEFEGERFFERAFSPGKEAASSLALANILGRDAVLEDLRSLKSSYTGTSHAAE